MIARPDPVFRAAPVGQLKNAHVGDRNQNDWFYAQGFVEAADALVKLALTRNPSLNDRFFSPACFLYRHASELTLKYLIQHAEKIVHLKGHAGDAACSPSDLATVDKKLAETHSLECLITWLDKRLKCLTGEALPTNVCDAMTELHLFDPDGQTFRYAHTKSGERHKKFQKTPNIDLDRISTRLSKAIRFLQNRVGDRLRREEQRTLAILLNRSQDKRPRNLQNKNRDGSHFLDQI